MKEEDILFLGQLIKSLEEAEAGLEKAYKKEDYSGMNKSKSIMLKIQKEIADMIK